MEYRRISEDRFCELSNDHLALESKGDMKTVQINEKHKERARQRRRRHAPWERSALHSGRRPR